MIGDEFLVLGQRIPDQFQRFRLSIGARHDRIGIAFSQRTHPRCFIVGLIALFDRHLFAFNGRHKFR